jgi:hypothetical protein
VLDVSHSKRTNVKKQHSQATKYIRRNPMKKLLLAVALLATGHAYADTTVHLGVQDGKPSVAVDYTLDNNIVIGVRHVSGNDTSATASGMHDTGEDMFNEYDYNTTESVSQDGTLGLYTGYRFKLDKNQSITTTVGFSRYQVNVNGNGTATTPNALPGMPTSIDYGYQGSEDINQLDLGVQYKYKAVVIGLTYSHVRNDAGISGTVNAENTTYDDGTFVSGDVSTTAEPDNQINLSVGYAF